jgi:hypothetical protein
MASIVYNSFLDDIARGNVDCDTDTFYAMVLGASYAESKSHAKRSDLTNEVSGSGYAAGGAPVAVSVTKDNTNNRVDIMLGGYTWTGAVVTNAQKVAYYKRRGGAASADELVALIDNGTPVTPSSGNNYTLAVSSSIVRLSN